MMYDMYIHVCRHKYRMSIYWSVPKNMYNTMVLNTFSIAFNRNILVCIYIYNYTYICSICMYVQWG